MNDDVVQTRPVKRLPKRPNFIVHWRVYSVTRTRRAPSSHRLQIGPGRQYERLGEWRKVAYFQKACPLDDQRNSELLSAANVNAFEDFFRFHHAAKLDQANADDVKNLT